MAIRVPPAAAAQTPTDKFQESCAQRPNEVAAAVILASAEPFAESIVASGRLLGIDEFLLIQWLAPLASEAPAVVIAVLFVLSGRAEGGLTTMISDKINQWTLLVGMLPLAMSMGARALTSMPLDACQHEEFFLTAAQSLFGVALLLRLRFSLVSAIALAALFSVPLVVAFVFRDNPARAIESLTMLAWVYLALGGSDLRDRRAGRVARSRRVAHGGNSPKAWHSRSCGLGACGCRTEEMRGPAAIQRRRRWAPS